MVSRYDGLCLDLYIEILDVSGPSFITDKSNCADFGLFMDFGVSLRIYRIIKAATEVT